MTVLHAGRKNVPVKIALLFPLHGNGGLGEILPMAPLFNWLKKRAGGVLLHPSALPSNQGIGTLGKSAFRFIDFLATCRLGLWQVCPLGPTGFGDSPYQCFSSFAGNPYLIDFETLAEAGLLDTEALVPLRALPRECVDYGALWNAFFPVLKKLHANVKKNPSVLKKFGDFVAFREKNRDWLDGYTLYSALKNFYKGKPWYEWPPEARKFTAAQNRKWPASVRDDVEMFELAQFFFFTQWKTLRKYAFEHGVQIIGDTPIFVALDSADVWQNPEIFQLDEHGSPTAVAGVPPDYFSADGQLWGNPLYDWNALAKTGYGWWLRRLHANFELYDIVRLDHFRAFYDYWRIPADSPTAKTGRWALGPGLAFFKTIQKTLGNVQLIAEDLGDMNDGVRKLLADSGLPGMAVLQFAFGGDASNLYLPHNIAANTIVYPGTHDNNTCVGWYNSTGEHTRDHFRRYFWTDGNAPHWTLINAAFKAHAKIAIVAMQDILGLGADARFNEPGTAERNWQWRLSDTQLDVAFNAHAGTLRELAELSGRTQ